MFSRSSTVKGGAELGQVEGYSGDPIEWAKRPGHVTHKSHHEPQDHSYLFLMPTSDLTLTGQCSETVFSKRNYLCMYLFVCVHAHVRTHACKHMHELRCCALHNDHVEVKGCQESILYPPWVPRMELGSSHPAGQRLLPRSYPTGRFYTRTRSPPLRLR